MSETERAELRERYLRFMSNLSGKTKTNVTGQIAAIKGDGTHFLVNNLKTPIGVQDVAVLRTSDTISVTVKYDDLA